MPGDDGDLLRRQPIFKGWQARSKELLAYLVAHPDGVAKERIIETFWPEVRPKKGDALLRDAIYHLRRQVSVDGDLKWSDAYITRAGETILLERGRWWTDAWEFESLIARADPLPADEAVVVLRRALGFYRGDFCDDSYFSWAEPVRERYRLMLLRASARLAVLLDKRGDAEEAIHVLDRAILVDPVCEDLYRKAIELEVSIGRTNAARLRYQRLVSVLAEELGEEPDPVTQQLMRALRTPRPGPHGRSEATG